MTRGSTIIWGKDELTRAPAPDAEHIRRELGGILFPLTRGKFTLVDEQDLELLTSYRWRWRPSANTTNSGYVVRSSPCKNGKYGPNIFLHRSLIDVPPGYDVDHINRNSLDNRRCNLRVASRSQNMANVIFPTRPNRTGFRGVSFRRGCNLYPYRAEVSVNSRRLRGPNRATAVEAAKDYDDIALSHFGEFATLNFPRGEAS